VTEDTGEIDRKEDLDRIKYMLKAKKFIILDYLRKNY